MSRRPTCYAYRPHCSSELGDRARIERRLPAERLAVQRSGRRHPGAAILRRRLCGDQIRCNGLFDSRRRRRTAPRPTMVATASASNDAPQLAARESPMEHEHELFGFCFLCVQTHFRQDTSLRLGYPCGDVVGLLRSTLRHVEGWQMPRFCLSQSVHTSPARCFSKQAPSSGGRTSAPAIGAPSSTRQTAASTLDRGAPRTFASRFTIETYGRLSNYSSTTKDIEYPNDSLTAWRPRSIDGCT